VEIVATSLAFDHPVRSHASPKPLTQGGIQPPAGRARHTCGGPGEVAQPQPGPRHADQTSGETAAGSRAPPRSTATASSSSPGSPSASSAPTNSPRRFTILAIGAPGAGKTSLAHHLAHTLLSREVPALLADARALRMLRDRPLAGAKELSEKLRPPELTEAKWWKQRTRKGKVVLLRRRSMQRVALPLYVALSSSSSLPG